MLAYAKALLATNRPAEAVPVLSHRSGGGPAFEYLLGKAYVQNGQSRTGAEVLRRVYYSYPTSSQADAAESDLKKIPEAASLPAVTFAEHQQRADGLYKGRRWAPAVDEYKVMAALAPPAELSQVNIHLANSLMKLGDNRQAKEVLARIPDDGSEASAEKWYQSAEIARNTNDDAELTTILQHMRATTPNSPWLESALFTAGNMYLLRQDYDRAIDYYREIHETISLKQQGVLRPLEVRVADLSSEPAGSGEKVFRPANRVLSRFERSLQRHVLAWPHG